MAETPPAVAEVKRPHFILRHPGLVVVAVLLLVAVWIDLGPYQRNQTSDSLVPVLQSLYRWTPFFWENNRNGSLVPLLAMPFHNPVTNLFVEDGIILFLGLAAFFLIARYLAPSHTWVLAGTVSGIIFLVCLRHDIFRYLRGYPVYAVSLALGMASLNLLCTPPIASRFSQRVNLAVASLLMLAAVWVNIALPIVLVPIVVCKAFLMQRVRMPLEMLRSPRFMLTTDILSDANRTLLSLGILVGTFVLNYAFSQTQFCVHHWGRLDLRPSSIITAYAGMAENSLEDWVRIGHLPLGLTLLGAVGVLTLLKREGKAAAMTSISAAECLLVGAASLFLAMGLLQWMQLNGYESRYLLPSMALGVSAVALFVSMQVMAFLRDPAQRSVAVIAPIILALVTMAGFPAPSTHKARNYLLEMSERENKVIEADNVHDNMSAIAHEVIDSGCTHMTGDYWRVWTTIFHANLILYERGSDRKVWAIADWCGPTRPYWDFEPRSRWRVAQAIEEDPSNQQRLLNFYELPKLEQVKVGKTIRIFKVSEPVKSSPSPKTILVPMSPRAR